MFGLLEEEIFSSALFERGQPRLGSKEEEKEQEEQEQHEEEQEEEEQEEEDRVRRRGSRRRGRRGALQGFTAQHILHTALHITTAITCFSIFAQHIILLRSFQQLCHMSIDCL